MTARALALLAILSVTITAAAEDRVLAGTFPAVGVSTLRLTNGVGDVAITAEESAPEITVEVTLVPRRGGLFSSYRHAQQEVDSAELASRTAGEELVLGLESSSNEPRFEASWVIVLPARIGVALELGVGDATIRDVAGVSLELGVGDAAIEVADGAVDLEVGVGDATVQGPAERFGRVEAAAGVGSADIVVREQRVTGDGFVGQSSSWQGAGPRTISVEVGVGDARIRLH